MRANTDEAVCRRPWQEGRSSAIAATIHVMRHAEALADLQRDLREVFNSRLRSLVVHDLHGSHDMPVATMALVEALSPNDLRACANYVGRWHDRGLATPLLLGLEEFTRALDAFPFEFGAILAHHEVVYGPDPFAGLRVDPGDLRRACEVQARSHLLHLREAFIETRGRDDLLAQLVARSSAPLAALLRNVSQLPQAPVAPALLLRIAELEPAGTVSADEARRLFPDYLLAIEQLVAALDRWSAV